MKSYWNLENNYVSEYVFTRFNWFLHDYNGNPRWVATCSIRSHVIAETAYATSKKVAKKYAAYLCICNICGLEDQYENEEN